MICMELRCEDRCEPYADGDRQGERCWSYDNDGCMQYSGDSLAEGTDGLRELFNVAKESGWRRILGHGWVCPHCMGKRKEQPGGV